MHSECHHVQAGEKQVEGAVILRGYKFVGTFEQRGGNVGKGAEMAYACVFNRRKSGKSCSISALIVSHTGSHRQAKESRLLPKIP